MRLMSRLSGIAAFASGIVGATIASAQDLPIIGVPTPGGTGFQPAATELAAEIHALDYGLHVISALITLFVLALIAVIIVKYNGTANKEPARFTHNTPIEIAWTLGPIVILVFIGGFSLPVLFNQQEIPEGDIVIKTTGHQWYWNYEYPDEGILFDSYMIGAPATGGDNRMTPEVSAQLAEAGYTDDHFLLATDTAMVVPTGKTIVVQVTGADVIHSWTIPAFGVKQDAVPGRLAELWFEVEEGMEGIYFGQCSELCGIAHAYMPITVHAVTQEAYDAWLLEAKELYSSNGTAPTFKVAQAD